MHAWLIEQVTEDGHMAWAERPDPAPTDGHYVVRVEAAGVNFADTLMVRGRYQRKPAPPFVPGIELAGAIVAAGAGCSLPVGQRICASVATGAFAELAAVPQEAATPVPQDVPAEVALVLLGVNYPTSYYALHQRAGLRAGETVLVHAGAGGVGSAAVQIARAAGARVIATAGSERKRATCLELGAEAALDYGASGWVDEFRRLTGGAGADVIYDPVGGRVAVDSLRCLAWQGRLLVIGFAAGAIPELPANRLLLKDGAALGVLWGEVRTRDPVMARHVADAVLSLYRNRRLDPLIGARFPLTQAPEALAALAARGTVGKVLLLPP